MRTRTVLLISLIALWASTVPHAAGNGSIPPQDDGGSGGDASSACSDPSPVLGTNDAVSGNLHPPQDKVDYYGLEIAEADVGWPVEVTLRAGSFEMYLDVFMPDCGRNVVASSPACERADRCLDGHKNVQGQGHAVCSAGHAGDEDCDTEQGSGDQFTVTFTPSEAGIYGIRVAIPANADEPKGRIGPGDVQVQNCHQFCFDYDMGTSGGADPVQIE